MLTPSREGLSTDSVQLRAKCFRHRQIAVLLKEIHSSKTKTIDKFHIDHCLDVTQNIGQFIGKVIK